MERVVTSFGQPLPQIWEEKLELFKLFVKNQINGIKMSQVGNMGDVALSFDMPIQYHNYTKSGIQRHDSYEEIYKWIVTSWDGITSKCVKMVSRRRKFMNLIKN